MKRKNLAVHLYRGHTLPIYLWCHKREMLRSLTIGKEEHRLELPPMKDLSLERVLYERMRKLVQNKEIGPGLIRLVKS